MTNKDYDYLEDLLKEVIVICYNRKYHPKMNFQPRIEKAKAIIGELPPDEKKYIRAETLKFFQTLKEDHQRNISRRK